MKSPGSTRPHTAIALGCAGVSKRFPVVDGGKAWHLLFGAPRGTQEIKALDNISLTVPKGQFAGILGRNGAGKSTLLRVLGGVYEASSGSVDVNGSLSGLFELGGLGNRFITGREYARRFLQFYGTCGKELATLMDDIKDFSELDAAFDHRVLTYSSGMVARLYFATATALQYDVYLIDEILSVGDAHFQAKSWNRMRERFAAGASGVLVTHDWSAVLKLCEQAHILDHGRIIASGPSEKIVQEYLKVPYPTGDIARFADIPQQGYSTSSGEDSEFTFTIERRHNVPLALSYSIEAFRFGVGWEVLLHGSFLPIEDIAMRFSLRLGISKLPISAGHYYLNLFLTSPQLNLQTALKVYDSRTWTNGSGIELIVEGRHSEAMVSHPLVWRPTALLERPE